MKFYDLNGVMLQPRLPECICVFMTLVFHHPGIASHDGFSAASKHAIPAYAWRLSCKDQLLPAIINP